MKRMAKGRRKGFTIIELMLAMGFLSALLVTIALLVVQITGIYQKGLSLRAVNSQGKQLIDELTRVVGGSPIVNVSPEPNAGVIDNEAIKRAQRQYFVSKNGIDKDGLPVQYNGTFCTGAFSYIWNTWYTHSRGGNLAARYSVNGKDDFKMLRVRDPERRICAQANGTGMVDGVPTMSLTVDIGTPIELINSDESDLILYDFTVFPATQNSITGQTFYSATFILATIRGGVNIQSSGDFCDVEQSSVMGLSSDFNYCAVNKFNFAMRATGYTDGEDEYGERGVD